MSKAEEIADAILNGKETINTDWGRKSRIGLIAMIRVSQEADKPAPVPITRRQWF